MTMKRKAKMSANYPYDLIAIDVDGTLLNSQKELSLQNEEAVKAARESGVLVSLVTGRSTFSLKPILERLGIDQPYIGSGGAFIIDPAEDRIIDYRPLGRPSLKILVSAARAQKTAIFFYLPDAIYCEASPGALEGWKSPGGYTPIQVKDILRDTGAAPTKVAIYGNYDRLIQTKEQAIKSGARLSMSFPHPWFLDVTREDADKGHALIRLATYLQIPTQRILVIGDAENDLPMFRVAGFSVAMGNSTPDVKAAADLIAPSNDEDGVAWALQRLILSNPSK